MKTKEEALQDRVVELEDTKEVLIRTVNKFKSESEGLCHAIADHYGVVASDSGPISSKRVAVSLESLREVAFPSVCEPGVSEPDGEPDYEN